MISLKIPLGVLLVMGMLAIPTTVAAESTPTYIDVTDTEYYNPDTNTFYTDITKTDHDENLIVQVREKDSKKTVRGRNVHFYLYEKRDSDMNGNTITRERLFEEEDYSSWFEDDYEVNIAKWFQTDELKNLPNGEYDVLVYFAHHNIFGDFASSYKLINLDYRSINM